MTHAHNFKDITGHQYGYLTAVKPTGVAETYNKKTDRIIKRAKWLFKCECGNDVEKCRATMEQYKHQGLTMSCGCKSFKDKLGNKHGLWKGCGDISLAYFNSLKRGATRRGHRQKEIPFDLNIEYLWELYLKQDGKCKFTDESIIFGTTAEVKNKANRKPTASLDRIDSSKGYVKGNVQWVHKITNFMKQDMKDADFIEWCKKVAQNNR